MKTERLTGRQISLILGLGFHDRLIAHVTGAATALADPHLAGWNCWDRQESRCEL